MSATFLRIMEPLLDKLALAIRNSQGTDALQNRIMLSLGLVGLALLIGVVIYLYIRNRIENRNDQQVQPQIQLERV